MIEAPLALAFAAGLVATMNPCGFAMLPAYLSYFVGIDDGGEASRVSALRRALIVGSVMSASFLLVFGVTGILITAGFRAVIDWIPWIALAVGVVIAVLGMAMLFGYELNVRLPRAKKAGKGRDLRSVFGFGVSYGVASLSCTLPVFLSVVATQVTRTNFVSGVATFVAYGLAMSLMLMGITVVLALGKQTLVQRLRASSRYINRVAGAVLVVAGTYIVWFWATNLASGADALNNSGAFGLVESLSQRALDFFGRNAAVWGLTLGGLIAGTVIYVVVTSRRDNSDGPAPPEPRKRSRLALAAGAVAMVAAILGVNIISSNSGETTAATMPDAEVASRGPIAPDTPFTTFDGATAAFADYRGTPLVVNFWASWCPSCVAELSAAFVPVQEQFGAEVAFLGLNLQDERDKAVELVEETGVQFDLAEDPNGDVYQTLGGLGMPFTLFISADGEIIEKHNGPLTAGQLEDAIVENLLAGATS